jgi:hypothetical protein
LLIAVGYTVGVGHAGDAPCGVRDFTVDNLSWSRSETVPPDYIAVRGRIINHCSEASGVQITVTVNGTDGKPLTGDSFWPNSTQDIAPSTTYWFVAPIRLPDGRIGSRRERYRNEALARLICVTCGTT